MRTVPTEATLLRGCADSSETGGVRRWAAPLAGKGVAGMRLPEGNTQPAFCTPTVCHCGPSTGSTLSHL